MAEKNLRINESIRAPRVRVIDPEGNQLGVISRDDALDRAEDFGFDLVEVAPEADPPVCRIMDYGKYKYQQKKRATDSRKKASRVELKEVKLRPRTDEHDLSTKINNARRFIEGNNKVKFTVMFRGREVTHPEIGRELLDRAAERLSDVARVEQSPRMEGRQMVLILTPERRQ